MEGQYILFSFLYLKIYIVFSWIHSLVLPKLDVLRPFYYENSNFKLFRHYQLIFYFPHESNGLITSQSLDERQGAWCFWSTLWAVSHELVLACIYTCMLVLLWIKDNMIGHMCIPVIAILILPSMVSIVLVFL